MNIFFLPIVSIRKSLSYAKHKIATGFNYIKNIIISSFEVMSVFSVKMYDFMVYFIRRYVYPIFQALIVIALVVLLVYSAYLLIWHFSPVAERISAERVLTRVKTLQSSEQIYLQKLIDEGKITTAPFYLDRIISFYEMLITFLLGLGVLGGLFGYFYIRRSHKRDIKEEVTCKETKKVFTEITEAEVKKALTQSIENGDLKYHIDLISSFQERIEFLENAINNDDGEIIVNYDETREKSI